jgi:flavin reductase (DIM6/NTAB) family NADH-FMN oxidoreductase RutF
MSESTKRHQPLKPTKWQPPPLVGQALLLTTASPTGEPHLEPTTRVCPLCDDPPLVGVALDDNTLGRRQLMKTKGFVINIVSAELAQVWWAAGHEGYRGLERINRLGIELEPAETVAAPRIVECPAHLECRLEERKRLPGATLFIGRVTAYLLASRVEYAATARQRLKLLDPCFWLRGEEDLYSSLKQPRRVQG